MDAIRKAIRAALARGNAGNPEHRERVYRSAQQALENALDHEGVTDPADRQLRRQRLLDAIGEIEQDYLPATAPVPNGDRSTPPAADRVDPSFDAPHPQARDPHTAGRRDDARVDPVEGREHERRPARSGPGRSEPVMESPVAAAGRAADPGLAADDLDITVDGDGEPPRGTRRKRRRGRDGRPRRRPYAWTMLVLTFVVFALLGAGFWAASNADYEFVLEQFLREVEPAEDYTPEAGLGGGADDRAQIVLYEPGAGPRPGVFGGLSADLVEAGQQRVLHIEGGGSEEAAILIPISRDTLARLAGLPYTVSVRARSDALAGAALLVSCDFAGLGDCGTRRYHVEAAAGDLLFAGTMGDGAPEDEGAIRIALPQAESELELFSVILLVGDT